LTLVDVSVNVSMIVDVRGGAELMADPSCPPDCCPPDCC
jgi:hypothetical protein